MSHILLISTGGTIASGYTENGLAPALTPAQLLAFVPEAAEFCTIDTISPFQIDSTNVNPENWLALSAIIEENYHAYDGFVICHGTDTMAYTAAALSYLIQSSAKPIVITGSQRPISEPSTDGRDNLLDALRFASDGKSGVVIVFGHKVIAGTRARKTRTRSYDAFSSINFPELAVIHGRRIVRYLPPPEADAPVFYHALHPRVALLKLIPGLSPESLALVGTYADGIIIESYGVGGIPDRYLEALDALIAAGKTVIMATQVPQEGSDIAVYQVGYRLKRDYRLLETYDMTLEATVTKLMWALSMGMVDGEIDGKEVRKYFIKAVNYDLLF